MGSPKSLQKNRSANKKKLVLQRNGVNVTSWQLSVTDMRVSHEYAIYDNWSQTLILGVIPAALLVYFNTKIYQDIR